MNIWSAEETKWCVEMMCRHVPGHWTHGQSDRTLSPALGALHSLHPWQSVSSSHVSWRVWSHDLDLANQCAPSLGTMIGTDQSGPRTRPQAGFKGRGGLALPEGVGACEVRLQQWEGVWVHLGQLVTFLRPLGQSRWPEKEGAAEPRGWERRFLLWSLGSTWDRREAACPWVLSCLTVSLFGLRWVFCPAGYVKTLEMHLCGFWLASGKKCQMTLGDSSLIWIQVISLESEVKVPQSCPPLGDPVGYTVHGILQARILEWVAFPFSRGSSQSRDWTQVSRIAGRFFTSWATREAQEYCSG